MAIVRWEPFKELEAMQDRINRLFNETLFQGKEGKERGHFMSQWSPNVNVFEDKDHISIEADLPGMEQKNIEINIQNNVLTFKGERRIEREENQEGYLRVEKNYGVFSRSFDIPASVNAEKVSASYEKGVLKIHLPKQEEARPKQITVKVE